MAVIIGHVTYLKGEFLARAKDGSVRELKVGDPIYAMDLVYDPSHTSANKIVIDLLRSDEDLMVNGDAEILFDASVTEPDHMEESTFSEADVAATLAEASSEQSDPIDALLKEFGDIDVDETALGEEDVRPTSHTMTDSFATESGAEADVQSGLQHVASHDYTLQTPTDPFESGNVDLTALTTPEASPSQISPVETSTPQPPVIPVVGDNETQNNIRIQDTNGDGVVNAKEAHNLSITGSVEPGSVIDAVTITDGVHTIRIPNSAIEYSPDSGFFRLPNVDVSTLNDGTLTASITSTDRVGNSTTSSDSIVKDATPPNLSITLDPVTADDVVNALEAEERVELTGHVSGDVKAGDTVALSVAGHTYYTAVDENGDFATDVPGSNLVQDEDHTVQAYISISDEAGNIQTATADRSYDVDTMAPSIGVYAPDMTNDTTPLISGMTDAPVGSTVTLTVTDSQGTQQTFSAIVADDGSYQAEVPNPLPEGTYSVHASVSDVVGNVSEAVDRGNTIDTTAPSAPEVKILDDANDDGFISGSEWDGGVDVKITLPAGVLPGDTLNITLPDGRVVHETVTQGMLDNGYTFNIETTEGTRVEIEASVTDRAGNEGPVGRDEVIVDTTAPQLTITLDEITSDDVINATEASGTVRVGGVVGGDAQEGDKVTLQIANNVYEGVVDANHRFAIDVPGEDLVNDADHTIVAAVTTSDPAGNSATAQTTHGYGVDTDARVVLDPLTGDNMIGSEEIDHVIVTGYTNDVEAGQKVHVWVTDPSNGSTTLMDLGETTVGDDGKWSLSDVDLSGLPEGNVVFKAEVSDMAGNRSTTEMSVTIDTTAPSAPEVKILDDANDDGFIDADEKKSETTVDVRLPLDAREGDTLTVSDGETTHTIRLGSDEIREGHVVTTFPTPAEGSTLTVNAHITDSAGNTGPAASDSAVVDTTASIADDQAVTDENDSVTIDVLANDEPDVRIISVDTPTDSHGNPLGAVEIVEENGKQLIRFTPSQDFDKLAEGESEQVRFTYRIEDAAGNISQKAHVDVAIHGVNDLPDVSDKSVQLENDGSATFTLDDYSRGGAKDVEDDANPLKTTNIEIVSLPSSGVLKADLDGDGELEELQNGSIVPETTEIHYETIDHSPVLFGTKNDTGTLDEWGAQQADGSIVLAKEGIYGEVVASDSNGNEAVGFQSDGINTHDGTGIGVVDNQIDLKNSEKLTISFDAPVANGEIGLSSVGGWFRSDSPQNGRAVWKAYLGDRVVASGEEYQDATDDGNPNTVVVTVDQPFDRVELSVEADQKSPNFSVQYIEVNPIVEDSFSYRAIDSDGGISETAIVTLSGAQSDNFSPDANTDHIVTNEDVSVTFDPLTNDIDTNGHDTIRLDGIDQAPRHGTVVINNDGTVTYTPEANYSGEDSFVYRIVDDEGVVDAGSVTVEVKEDGLTLAPTVELDPTSDTGESDSDHITADNTPTLTGTSENGATIVVTDENGMEVGRTVADTSGKYDVTLTTLTDGDHTLTVTATDTAGHRGDTTIDVTIDTEAPEPVVEIVEDTNDDGYITKDELDGDVDVKITLPDGTKVGDILTVTHPDGTINRVSVDQHMIDDGYLFSVPAQDGDTLQVQASLSDEAGNTSGIGSDRAVVDTTTDLTFVEETAGYKNVVGIYEVDEDGNPTSGRVLIDDQNKLNEGEVITTLDPAKEYHFFLIANGADEVDKDSQITFDNSGDFPVAYVDGVQIQHRIYFDDPRLNADNYGDHFKVVPDSDGNGVTIYMEDLPTTDDDDYPYDGDFEDIVLHTGIPVENGVVVMAQPEKDANGHLLIDGKTEPGATVWLTDEEGNALTSEVQADNFGKFSIDASVLDDGEVHRVNVVSEGTADTRSSLSLSIGSDGDDTLLFEGTGVLDGRDGEDVLVLADDASIDFSNLPFATKITNVEAIDLTQNGDHTIENLTLEDVIEISGGENTLVIDGESGDHVEIPAATGDYTLTTSTDGNYDVYTYSSSNGDPTVTLKIDQDIDQS